MVALKRRGANQGAWEKLEVLSKEGGVEGSTGHDGTFPPL